MRGLGGKTFAPALAGVGQKLLPLLVFALQWRQGGGVERLLGLRVDAEFAGYLIATKLDQIICWEFGAKLFLEDIGILIADDKGS